MAESLRINLVISPTKESGLHKHLSELPKEDRAAVFKYFAFAGFVLASQNGTPAMPQAVPEKAPKAPHKKKAGVQHAPTVSAISTAKSSTAVQYAEKLTGDDLGLNF